MFISKTPRRSAAKIWSRSFWSGGGPPLEGGGETAEGGRAYGPVRLHLDGRGDTGGHTMTMRTVDVEGAGLKLAGSGTLDQGAANAKAATTGKRSGRLNAKRSAP